MAVAAAEVETCLRAPEDKPTFTAITQGTGTGTVPSLAVLAAAVPQVERFYHLRYTLSGAGGRPQSRSRCSPPAWNHP